MHSLAVDHEERLLLLAADRVMRVDPSDGSVEPLFTELSLSGLAVLEDGLFGVVPGFDAYNFLRDDEVVRLDPAAGTTTSVQGGGEWRCPEFSTCFRSGWPMPTAQRAWPIEPDRLLLGGGGWWGGFTIVSVGAGTGEYHDRDDFDGISGAARSPTNGAILYLTTYGDTVTTYDLEPGRSRWRRWSAWRASRLEGRGPGSFGGRGDHLRQAAGPLDEPVERIG